MIAPDAFRLNAYRVLRISASASASDIQKAAARMREAAASGVPRTTEVDIPRLGDVPRGEADISAAVCRLSDPVNRLTDRLFWFCQLRTPSGAQRTSADMDPTGHDTVLRDLIDATVNLSAMQDGLDERTVDAWIKALRPWYAVICDDDYWFLTLIYEDQGGFDAPATPEEVEALRADAVRIAAEPLILAARAALVASEDEDAKEMVRRVRTALSSLTDTGRWASDAIGHLDGHSARPQAAGVIM